MIFEIISSASITYLFVNAEPIIRLKNMVGITMDSNNMLVRGIAKLMSCCLCSGFWIGLIITGDIYMAAIISLTAEIIDKRI